MNKKINLISIITMVFIFLIAGCSRNNAPGDYKVGDTGPGGGIVFFVSAKGFLVEGYGSEGDTGYFPAYKAHYLEAAHVNVPDSYLPWCNCELSSRCYIDGVPGLDIVAGNMGQGRPNKAIRATIGQGRKNTALIVNYHNKDDAENNAAIACNEYSNNDKNDWFLPSIGELYALHAYWDSDLNYDSDLNTGILKLMDNSYWSSSQEQKKVKDYEPFNVDAWYMTFQYGHRYGDLKFAYNYVRAIRAF